MPLILPVSYHDDAMLLQQIKMSNDYMSFFGQSLNSPATEVRTTRFEFSLAVSSVCVKLLVFLNVKDTPLVRQGLRSQVLQSLVKTPSQHSEKT